MKVEWLVLLLVLQAQTLFAHDRIPGTSPLTPVALVGGTIHTISGPVVEHGTLLFDNGRIVAVGTDVAIPPSAEQISCSGKHVFPGFIDPNSIVGLSEVDQARATQDSRETGRFNANVEAQKAFNGDSELLPVTRSNGVLTSVVTPRGGLICGQSAVMNHDGWQWEDMTVKSPVAMAMEWPNMRPSRGWWERRSEEEQNAERDRLLGELSRVFEETKAYAKALASSDSSRHFTDMRFRAMLPVIRRELPLLVVADDLDQIQAAVQFAVRERLRVVICGGYDAPLCADLLKRNDIPVVVSRIHRTPKHPDDDYSDPYSLPDRLSKAGVRFCIGNAFDPWNARNLPYSAGMAAAFGLSRDDAVRAITLSTAEIFGVADRLGSLDPGKDATLFICDGDPLEIPTQIERAWIMGRSVDLKNRQTALHEKYSEKLRRAQGR